MLIYKETHATRTPYNWQFYFYPGSLIFTSSLTHCWGLACLEKIQHLYRCCRKHCWHFSGWHFPPWILHSTFLSTVLKPGDILWEFLRQTRKSVLKIQFTLLSEGSKSDINNLPKIQWDFGISDSVFCYFIKSVTTLENVQQAKFTFNEQVSQALLSRIKSK